MRSLKTYYSILRKKGFYTCLRELKKAVWPLWFTRNREAIELIQAERASRYLWCKYGSLITKPLDAPQINEPTRIIWICWLQGLVQAPEIVKKCVTLAKHHMPDYKVQILTSENIFDFVTLPESVIQKYQKGIISFAHFSDILRTALLVQHGGIWLDATVLLTDSIPAQMTNLPLFFFQKSVLSHIPHFGSNWFLIAQKGSPVMKRILELLFSYWERENTIRDYFIYHLFLYLLLTRNEQGIVAKQQIPYIPNVDAHTLQFSLFENFSDTQWKQITSRSSIHKLTWKFNHNEPLDKPGTFYDYILHHLHI